MDTHETPAGAPSCDSATNSTDADPHTSGKQTGGAGQTDLSTRDMGLQYATILDSLGDAIHVIDRDYTVTFANAALRERCATLGMPSDPTGARLEDAWPKLPQTVLDEYEQVFATRQPLVTDETTTINGIEFTSETRKIPLLDDGTVVGIVTAIRDITEQKRGQAELRQSERRLRAFFESSADAIVVMDLDATVTDCNDAALHMYGYESPERVLGRNCIEFVAPEARAEMVEGLARTLRNGTGSRAEHIFQRPDGTTFPAYASASVITDSGGQPVGLIAILRDITESKRAEEALRESEARMRAIFDTSADAVFVVDLDGTVVLANPATDRMHGYEPGEMIGLTGPDFVHPDSLHVFSRFLTELPVTGYIELEAVDLRKDGSAFDIEVRGSTFQYGGQQRLLGLVRDVTDRKRADAALRLQRDLAIGLAASTDLAEAAEVLLQATLRVEGIDSGGLYLIDTRDGALTLAAHLGISPEFVALVSRYCADAPETRQVLAGHPLYATIDDLPPYGFDDAARIEGLRALAVLPIAHQGSVIASLSASSRIIDDFPVATRETLEAIAAQAGTVLARISAEGAVREREQRIDLALHGGDLGTWDWDVRSDRVIIDTRWLVARGYLDEVADVCRRDIVRLNHPDDIAANDAALERHLQGDTPFYEAEFRVGSSSSDWTWVLARGRVIERDNNTGDPIRVCGTYLDITEQKRLKEHLLQTTKMEAIGRLAGGVAHDFNNILTAISGYTEFAIEQLDLGSPAHADLEQVTKAASKATALTRQLLAFSRQQVTEPRPVNLNAVVRDMEKMLRRVIGEDLSLTTVLAPDLGLVWIDLGQVEQVIMNLCVNARDAMPGGGRLTISTRNVTINPDSTHLPPGLRPGEYVCLNVSDTGVGMDAKTIARIYEPFFTTKQPGEGTGLGLATVYGIVQQAGGHIECRSEPAAGTLFTVYLPRHIQSVDDTRRPADTAQVSGGNERVLLVEDDDVVREFASEALRRQGYNVVEVSGPREALAIAEQIGSQIAILVTDVIMPEMTGRELAETLIARHPHLAVLYVSGYAASIIEQENLIGPGTSFLGKPFSVRELAEKVREVLDGRAEAASGYQDRDMEGGQRE